MGFTEEQHSLPVTALPSKEVELPPTEFQVTSVVPENIIKLVKNDGTKEVYQVIGQVEVTVERLAELARKTKCDVNDLITVWSSIPVKNEAGSDSLAESGEAIIAVSDAVDKRYPNMSAHEKTALKFRIMAELLNSKAELLDSKN